MARNFIQQGDVLIKRITDLPKSLKTVEPKSVGGNNPRHILAEGEVTGHAHAIDIADGICLLESDDGTLYLKNDSDVTIKHEEHKHLQVPPGMWEIGNVVEYDPLEEEIRRVAD